MTKAKEKAIEAYPDNSTYGSKIVLMKQKCFVEGYHQAEKDVAESFAKIIRSNLRGIGNGIQNMFEQLYTEITGEKMYKGFKD